MGPTANFDASVEERVQYAIVDNRNTYILALHNSSIGSFASQYTKQPNHQSLNMNTPGSASIVFPSLRVPPPLQAFYSTAPVAPTPRDIDMALPPENRYDSLEALTAAINTWSKTRGYAFVKGRSKKLPGSNRTKTYFFCDRRHKPARDNPRDQQSQSRGVGCEFSVLACQTVCKTAWELKHRDGTQYRQHNHAPSAHPAAHPIHRQLPPHAAVVHRALHDAGQHLYSSPGV